MSYVILNTPQLEFAMVAARASNCCVYSQKMHCIRSSSTQVYQVVESKYQPLQVHTYLRFRSLITQTCPDWNRKNKAIRDTGSATVALRIPQTITVARSPVFVPHNSLGYINNATTLYCKFSAVINTARDHQSVSLVANACCKHCSGTKKHNSS